MQQFLHEHNLKTFIKHKLLRFLSSFSLSNCYWLQNLSLSLLYKGLKFVLVLNFDNCLN